MENNILISILIPTYNRPKYLKICLDSILFQSGFQENKLEFIISDNSDNLETKALVETYIKNYPNKNIIYNKNTSNL
jgi:glycosyltransferase involved in cell wall biosynthesis